MLAPSASADIVFPGGAGSGAGQTQNPSALAVDRETGTVYVADTGNNRIDVFDENGKFEFAFGWKVNATTPEEKLQTCTALSGCLAGLVGSGAGQFNSPRAIAVDNDPASLSKHNVYVFDGANRRIQAFEPNGTFLVAWGRGVIESGATGTGDLTSGSTTITNVKTTAKAFAAGQAISGEGIPLATRISKIEAGKIVLSNPASETKAGGTLSVAEGTGNVPGNELQTVKLGANTTGGTFTLTFSVPNPSASSATTATIPFNASAAEVQAKLAALANLGAGNVEVSGSAGGPWSVEFKGARFTDTNLNQMSASALGLTVPSGEPKEATVVTSREGEALEVCTPANEAFCKAGSSGGSEGQFDATTNPIALGPGGVVYVGGQNFETQSRVQEFEPSGAFIKQILLVRDECDEGKASNLVPLKRIPLGGLAVDSTGAFYFGTVAGPGGVRKYDSAGNLLTTCVLINPSVNIRAIAVDDADHLYVADNTEANTTIYEYDATTIPAVPLHTFYGNGTIKSAPISLAPYEGDIFLVESSSPPRIVRISPEPSGPVVLPFQTNANPVGNLRATFKTEVNPEGKATQTRFEFVDDASYDSEEGFKSPKVKISNPAKTKPPSIPADTDKFIAQKASFEVPCEEPEVELQAKIDAGECLVPSTVYHLRAAASNADSEPIWREGDEIETKTLPPITLGPEWSTSVGTDSARLHAALNPNGIHATAFFEFVEQSAYEKDIGEGGDGFAEAQKTATIDFGAGSEEVSRSALAFPLLPETTYRYRYIAVDFFGEFIGPDERTFTTFPSPPEPGGLCPNEALRAGASANLPDCRAYEMVSPVDKNGGDIVALKEGNYVANGTEAAPAQMDQASPDGGKFTYSAAIAFADALSAPYSSQYIATRHPLGDPEEGWTTHSVNAPREGPSFYGTPTEHSLKGFSEDLCSVWFVQDTDLALAEGAPAGVPNLYHGRNCGEAPPYELITTVAPPGFSKETEGIGSFYLPTVQAFTPDGSATAFRAPAALTPEARTVAPGAKLKCDVSLSDATPTYQWLSSGAPATGAGATKAEYTISAADAGKAVQCQVRAENEKEDENTGGKAGAIQLSSPVLLVVPLPATLPPTPPPSIPPPSVSAPLTVGGAGGQLLSCDPREEDWQGASSFEYSWYRNGEPLPGTAPTYTATNADLSTAATFQCVVTGKNAEGAKVAEASEVLLSDPAPDPVAPSPRPVVLDFYRAYLHDSGGLHLVSILPGGEAADTHASFGTAQYLAGKRIYDSVHHALSADGRRAFFSAGTEASPLPTRSSSPGLMPSSPLYLRINANQPQSTFLHGGARGTGKPKSGNAVVTSVTKISATPFQVGQTIVGDGIPPATTITAVGASTLTLSKAATKTVEAAEAAERIEAFSDCTEPEKACTLPVTEEPATFYEATPDASLALISEPYEEGGNKYERVIECDSEKLIAHEAAKNEIAPKSVGMMGTSTDLSRVYVVSEAVCSGGEENSEGAKAKEGKPNLYLYERGEKCGEGELTFVATLLAGAETVDEEGDELSFARIPANRTSRISKDGLHATFVSRAPLTGYDNTDAVSGQPDAEVFLYDAEEDQLRCISCNPSDGRPSGREVIAGTNGKPGIWAAATIPGWETEFQPSRPLSEDGSRLFFNSFEPLVSRDTNGREDVYQWERAFDKEECLEEQGGELFVPSSSGCLSLISSGKSTGDSEFLDASESGDDVFFTTSSSLVPSDPGLVDVYDARVEGGFPISTDQPSECEGEACQNPPGAPEFASPASAAHEGQGNVPQAATKPRCAKGKVRRKGRCVKKRHNRKAHRRAASQRRGAPR